MAYSREIRCRLSLYLHVPFCKTRCSYCDFNTYTNLDHLFGRYTNAISLEIERTLAAVAAGNYNPLLPLPPAETQANKIPLETIFFGGGTPSLLPSNLLELIFKSIRKQAEISPSTEITAEANPGTLSLEKLRALREIGFNRLSFGVQTFDDALLKSLGRTHNAATAVEAYNLARRAGFNNLNLDFIFGLPGQTLAAWRISLERAISLRPEHLSLYALTIEENTAMGKALARGSISSPDDDLMADMYLMASELLEKAGYIQYEISNWALPAKKGLNEIGPVGLEPQACRHNLVYWRNQPYLGFGPGAYSSFGGNRFSVIKDPGRYIARLQKGESVIELAEVEPITVPLKLADSIILALRLNEGLDPAGIEREFGRSLSTMFPGEVEKLTGFGLLEEFMGKSGEKRLRLTAKGRLLSNEVFIKFLPE